MSKRRVWLASGGAGLLGAGGLVLCTDNPVRREVNARMSRHTVESRMAELSPRVEAVWRGRCHDAGAAYPPREVVVVVLKREREVRVFAPGAGGEGARWVRLATYPVLAASGELGPKLRRGDNQVPEGVYRVESLNPNSRFHLALRVNYPSDDDRRIGAGEGRTDLGGDIMIHGGSASIGCVAIGDPAIEELFVLAGTVGIERVELLMCPCADPRGMETPATAAWLTERYRVLGGRLDAVGDGAR